jgi:hypothetical protein
MPIRTVAPASQGLIRHQLDSAVATPRRADRDFIHMAAYRNLLPLLYLPILYIT